MEVKTLPKFGYYIDKSDRRPNEERLESGLKRSLERDPVGASPRPDRISTPIGSAHLGIRLLSYPRLVLGQPGQDGGGARSKNQ